MKQPKQTPMMEIEWRAWIEPLESPVFRTGKQDAGWTRTAVQYREKNGCSAEAKARRGDFSYAERWLATGAQQGAGVLQSIKELLDHCQPETGRATS